MLFISFSSQDRGITDQITSDLKNAGLDIWYSPLRLNPGDNYAAEIARAIRNSSCLILLHSGNANTSPHILRELELALSNRKPIYPLRISPGEPNDAMEYYLSGVQWKMIYDNYVERIAGIIEFLKLRHDESSDFGAEGKPDRTAKPIAPTSVEKNGFSIIKIADETNIHSLLIDAIAIDSQSYQDNFIGIFERCLSWYSANPEIYTFATNSDGKAIGYVNAMPVEEETYQLMLEGSFLDNDILPEAIIQFTFPGEFYLYFCSIGVDSAHKNTRLFRALFDAFIAKMNRWCDNGFIVRHIVSDAVTRDGAKMCEIIGCDKYKTTDHDSSIYTLSMLPPQIKPTTNGVRELRQKYSAYYKHSSGLP